MAKPGWVYRGTQITLGLLLAWTVLSWIVTTNGLYYWFTLTDDDKVRVEYGRIRWTHNEGAGTHGTSAGLGGGGNRIEWSLETSDFGSGFRLRIPLWMPAAGCLFLLLLMAGVRLYRIRSVDVDAFS